MPLRFLLVALTLAGSVGVDQLTKQVAIETLRGRAGHTFLGDTFRLVYAENKGAFLSLGAGLPDAARFWVLTVAVGLVLLFILGYALFAKALTRGPVIGYSLIAGGGLSNWVDRALNDGRVVDFMNVGIGRVLRSGIFNVADLAIIAGIIVLMVHSWQEDRAKAKQAAATEAR